MDEGRLVDAVRRITNAFSFIQSRYENFSLYIPAIGTDAKDFKQYSMEVPREAGGKVQQVAMAGLVEGDQMRVIPEVWKNPVAPEGAPGPALPAPPGSMVAVSEELLRDRLSDLNGLIVGARGDLILLRTRFEAARSLAASLRGTGQDASEQERVVTSLDPQVKQAEKTRDAIQKEIDDIKAKLAAR